MRIKNPYEAAQNAILLTYSYYPNIQSPDHKKAEPEQVRFECARELLKNAKRCGYKVILSDGGSPDIVTKEFKADNVTLLNRAGVGITPRIQELFALGQEECYKQEKIAAVSVEIEKSGVPLLLTTCIDSIVQADKLKVKQIIVIERNSLQSYPKFQQDSEKILNEAFYTQTGRELDVSFNPRAVHRDAIPYFTRDIGEVGLWGFTYAPVIDAIFRGQKDHVAVTGLKIPFEYPAIQKEMEERRTDIFIPKRQEQLRSLSEVFRKRAALYKTERK